MRDLLTLQIVTSQVHIILFFLSGQNPQFACLSQISPVFETSDFYFLQEFRRFYCMYNTYISFFTFVQSILLESTLRHTRMPVK